MAGQSRERTALITGATSGIGLALAEQCAAHKHHLILVARRANELAKVAQRLRTEHQIEVVELPADLANPAVVDSLAAQIGQRGLQVDILINNAGYALYGTFLETDASDELNMINLNMVTLTRLTKLLLPQMAARQWGRVLNVASTAAFMPGPLMAVYYATKAYVLSLSEALNEELRGTGVTVTALCPGPTRTGFQSRANMESSKLVQGTIMDANRVAQAGYAALMAGRPVVIPGTMNKLQALAPRFMPRRFVPGTVRRAQARIEH